MAMNVSYLLKNRNHWLERGFCIPVRRSFIVCHALLTVSLCSNFASAQAITQPKSKRPGFPLAVLPLDIPAPRDNPTSKAKVALGQRLFFDPRLSGKNDMSCATCHQPEKAFADGIALGTGHDGKMLTRNTPSLLNAAFYQALTWDGRANSLEEQSLQPIIAPAEMNQDLTELERELGDDRSYVEQFQSVFGSRPTRESIAQALAAFERTLNTQPSPFDRFLNGEKSAISDSAKRGLDLFVGDAGCVRCHQGNLLSDGKFYRLGIGKSDQGREAITRDKSDRGKFRTPSLRNIGRTAPYMHDGSLKTLEDVVTFYYRGASTTSADGLELDIQPLLGQSFSEIPDLVAFLESLTGEMPKIDRSPVAK